MFGFNPKYDIIGVTAGHLYYYLEDVVPKILETEDWKVLRPPKLLVALCDKLQIHDFRLNEEDLIFEDEVAQAAAAGDIGAEEGEMNPGDIIDDNMINDDARN
jgi:hypothetical protein